MAEPGIKMEIVTHDFNRMLEELASIDPRIEFSQVLRSEAASVAAIAMRKTRAAQMAKIWKMEPFATMNGKVYYLGNRYPDHIWSDLVQTSKQAYLINQMLDPREVAKQARGLAKQSWLHIARSLNQPVKAPAYVISANYIGRQYPNDGTSSEGGSGTTATVTITNRLPYINRIGGSWALLGAMARRVRYFEQNMAHFAFRNIATRARAYKGIFVSPVPAQAGSDMNGVGDN